MVFPRLCAFSETLWSPPELRNWPDFFSRMNVHYRRLDALGVDYFTPFVTVGSWESAQMSESPVILERNITGFLDAPGHYRLALRHDSGDNGIAIDWVAVLENGEEIARDTHSGESGKRDRAHNYRFRLHSVKTGAIYTVRIQLHTVGGTDSRGSILMRHFRE